MEEKNVRRRLIKEKEGTHRAMAGLHVGYVCKSDSKKHSQTKTDFGIKHRKTFEKSLAKKSCIEKKFHGGKLKKFVTVGI